MTTTTLTARAPEVHGPGSGSHLHFLNHLATVKVRGGGDGIEPPSSMSVVQFDATRGFGAPLHRHLHEDELFVVLDGELAFHLGDDRFAGATGAIAYLPAEIPHTFQVVSDTATILNVCASRTHVPQFDRMVSALGAPLDEAVLPADVPIDPGHVAEICAAHGIEVLGPPPS